MARVCPLFSGSSGNSTYFGSADSGILVDAGVSSRSLMNALKMQEIDPAALGGVFITHEHSDHIKGLRVFLKQSRLPLFATAETLQFLAARNELPADAQVQEITSGKAVQVQGMEILPFATSHDAISSVGFRVTMPDGRTASIATDLGVVTQEVQNAITGSDLVLLEANYDDAMLGCSSYPYYLKRRIASHRGHLSNQSSSDEALRLVRTGTTRLILGHLSRENNLPTLAYETIRSQLELSGMRQGQDYLLSVAKRSEPSDLIVF